MFDYLFNNFSSIILNFALWVGVVNNIYYSNFVSLSQVDVVIALIFIYYDLLKSW